MEWSAVKQQVFAFESDIVVSAGAGSGKTAALVELYLRLLGGETRFPRQLGVEEIVAITFTDKAALEMKERIRSGMVERLATGDRAVLWKENLRAFPAAPIATFHAFCARILRENPAEAGIDPAFTLLDELAAWTELRGALDEVVEEELQTRTPGIRLLLEQYPLSGAGRGKGLREHLLDLRRKRSASGMGGGELGRITEKWQDEAAALFRSKQIELGELVWDAERVLGGKELAFHRQLRDLPELYHHAPLCLEGEETGHCLAAMAGCIGGNWGKEGELKKRLADCIEQLALAWRQVESAPVAAALIVLSERLEEAYRRRKERRGALDFDDLQFRTRDLLKNDGVVRDGCRRRFPVIMVDEFQDTNPLQKELLELFCGEGQRLFIVGDPKQSIYLFRGADVAVFGRAEVEGARRGGQTLYFQESFRSREGIIAFVNRLFSGVMADAKADYEVKYREGDHLEPQRRDWDGIPCVELLTVESGETGAERRRGEARGVARRILELVAGGTARYGDIALLFRRFTHLKLFERELRAHGIPYYVVKGKGFYRCQEVLDLLNFLRYLDFSGDLTALTGVFRSPLCGVSDETLYLLSRSDGGIGGWEKIAALHSQPSTLNSPWDRIDPADRAKLHSLALLVGHLRPLRDRLTLAELMEEILTGTDFVSSLYATPQGEQKAANLRKLIEFSRSFRGEGEGGVRRFVAYLTELVETEPTEAEAVISAEGEDVVRLMTIHQSKGLEFPVVFVPELGAAGQGDHSPVLYDDALGVGVKLAAAGGRWEPTLASRAIGELRNRKEAAELKRLLYVATTRARDYLVLSGEKGRHRSGSWRDWLDAFLEGEGAPLVKVTLMEPGQEPASGNRERQVPEVQRTDGIYSPEAVAEGVRRSLQFVPPLPSSMVFSPTALEDYENCPRKYYYKAVMGLDEGLFTELLGGVGTRKPAGGGMTPLEKGDFAHLFLERLDFSAGPAVMRAEGMRIAAARVPDPAAAGVAEVIDDVLAFAESPRGRALAGSRLMRECPFTLRLTGSASYYVRGAMDLVVVEADRVAVYDYKYLRKEDTDLDGYRFQLRVYMCALARAWPERRIDGRLLFLKGGDEEVVECDSQPFEGHLLRIMDDVRKRSVEEDFALREGCDGKHCPFRQRCLKGGSTFNVLG